MTASKVSVVICTRDRAESLRETLASIGRLTVPPGMAAELVVVDNGSTDGTAAVVHGAGLINLPVRHVVEPAAGLSRARNAALRATAAADVVLFTDDDVRVPPDWLAGMCGPILAGRADAVAGGVHFTPEYETLLAREPFRSRRGWFASTDDWDPGQTALIVGANMALGRRVIAGVGEFDPELGAGALGFGEESVYTWRLRQAGFRLVSALDVSVEHHFDRGRLTRATLLSMARRMGASQAWIEYHWAGGAALRRPFRVWRAWALWWAERLRAPWTWWGEAVSTRELERVEALAFWRQSRRFVGVPRKYPAKPSAGVCTEKVPG